jgi:hypothetical protein
VNVWASGEQKGQMFGENYIIKYFVISFLRLAFLE